MTPESRTRWTSCLAVPGIRGFMGMVYLTAGAGLLVTFFCGSASVMAQEYIGDQEPVPESVDQVVTPFELAFREKPRIPRFFPWLKEKLKDTPAFFRDIKLDLNVRTYYLHRDNYPGSSPQGYEAWALGGALSYQSGWFLDRLSLGTVFYSPRNF